MTTREQQIQARCQAATEGPWETEVDLPFNRHPRVCGGEQHRGLSTIHIAEVGNVQHERQDQWEADALFIAHAREDIPWLLARLAACEAALKPFADAWAYSCHPNAGEGLPWNTTSAHYEAAHKAAALTKEPDNV